MSSTLSRPSRLLIYIGAVTGIILLFRFLFVTVPPPPPGSLGSPGHPPDPVAPGVKLRILPLGDSITYGDGSSDDNAYRLELRKALVAGGSEFVDFIGSQSSGKNNEDNQHEGWGGARISGVLERVLAQGTLKQHPNVILLMAGTNDMKDHPAPEPADDAPHRLGVLMDAILCECPDAVLIVAKVTGQRQLFANLRVDKFNTAIEGVVAERANRGSKVKLVDQSKVAALELADDLHPNDAGYVHMARVWLAGLQGVPQDWYNQPVEQSLDSPPKVCDKGDDHWTGLMKAPPMPPMRRR